MLHVCSILLRLKRFPRLPGLGSGVNKKSCYREIATSFSIADRVRGDTELHWEELTKKRFKSSLYVKGTRMSAQEETAKAASNDRNVRRPQFGNRFLENPDNVFQHNAWDNVTWDPVQLEAAKKKVEENSSDFVSADRQETYEAEAGRYWDEFYSQHQNKFFKDRHWLFTEFPELSSSHPTVAASGNVGTRESSHESHAKGSTDEKEATGNVGTQEFADVSPAEGSTGERETCNEETDSSLGPESIETCRTKPKGLNAECRTTEEANSVTHGQTECSNVIGTDVSKVSAQKEIVTAEKSEIVASDVSSNGLSSFPGQASTKRILEVGCGVGNTIFPILQTDADPGLFVYGCDFAATAVDIVRRHAAYDPRRCHAFVCDISSDDPAPVFPFPDASLDVVVMIFVLSAIHPDKFRSAVGALTRLLRPGGRILFRDYGRYDMAQLRFKRGRCLAENFYARGDGTRVYFFTQEELRELFTGAGLTEEQNLIDRRLQVNRGRQLTMYRVWIQCKYRKPETS